MHKSDLLVTEKINLEIKLIFIFVHLSMFSFKFSKKNATFSLIWKIIRF